MNINISPSLMCCNLLNISEEIKRLRTDGADMLHIDIMDGCFVPNITFGIDTVRAIRKETQLPLDVHLMVKNNEALVDEFIKIGCDRICFHVSDGDFAIRTLNKIKESGHSAGVALTPAADESILKYIKDYLDFVTLMSVEPGFASQTFVPSVLTKIASTRLILGELKDITVDGNITVDTAVKCIRNGANTLVAGTSFAFDEHGYIENSIRIARVNIDKFLV